VDRRHAGCDRLLGPVSHAADVVCIAQPDDGDAVATRALDGKLHRLVCDRLTYSAVALDDQQRAAVGNDGDALVELKRAQRRK
jgi:hypothetical protein